ncbi:hypothetical protein [Neobacillus drentensis]|uniref:hypothetical protein n=1 Tax=Neobacillus drentensis TaxID=220684 RepID=UPI002FFF5AD2
MNNQGQLLEEIRNILQELLRSNQMVIQSNHEIKQLLLGDVEITESSSIMNNDHKTTNFITSEPTNGNVNADLFKRIINVYYNEEIERIKSNNVRKSARRVSVELGGSMCDFLNQNLKTTGLSFNRFPDGLIIITAKDKWVGAIKIISDLGFHRGDQWFEYAKDIVNHCEAKYGIENNRVFFVISSLRNGLEQKHVAKLLNRDIRSNWEFMNNRTWVDEYVEKFTVLTTCLADPHKQIYVMASAMHPNVIADELHKMNDDQKRETFKQIEAYDWISDINGLLNELRHLI